MSGASTVAGSEGNYRIEVADFGPIRHAAVDLRPLTVFVGPSNTGKSYLAMLVYALHQLLRGTSSLRPSHQSEDWYRLAVDMTKLLLGNDEFPRRFLKWWSEVGRSAATALPDHLASSIGHAFWQAAAGRFEQELYRCFGVDALDEVVCVESSESTSVISLHIRNIAGSELHRYHIRVGSVGAEVTGQIGELPRFDTSGIVGKYRPGLADTEDVPLLLSLVLDGLAETLTGALNRRAWYLPADRSNVMDNHQWLVSSLFQSATGGGPRQHKPLLTGVLADFVSGLGRIGQLSPSRFHGTSDQLEKGLLAGHIRVYRFGSHAPTFTYRPHKWNADLPLMRASSMVSELAPVVLYLRYLVEPGDLLIIEEPESHLHPALQATFARELARLVHSGVRVLLTTHSEWILEALANVVRLSELSEEQRAGIPGADVALAPDQVGAWLFKADADGGGSVVEEIPLDAEAGSFPVGFGEVTEALYNEWARIGNRIEAAKAAKTDQND